MDAIQGRALPLRGEDIDTDRIIPARYLTAITFDGLEKAVFEDDRIEAGKAGGVHPFDDARFTGAAVLLVQRNFGCGSSREHAPQAIHRWGINVIVGESFSDIFFGNSGVIGLPCVTAARADIEGLMARVESNPGLVVKVDLAALQCIVTTPGVGLSSQPTPGVLSFPISMPAAIRESFLAGTWDTTGMLLDRFGEVRARAASLPYITGF